MFSEYVEATDKILKEGFWCEIGMIKWLIHWADMDEHTESYEADTRKVTDFGRGYEQAISDILDRMVKFSKHNKKPEGRD